MELFALLMIHTLEKRLRLRRLMIYLNMFLMLPVFFVRLSFLDSCIIQTLWRSSTYCYLPQGGNSKIYMLFLSSWNLIYIRSLKQMMIWLQNITSFFSISFFVAWSTFIQVMIFLVWYYVAAVAVFTFPLNIIGFNVTN